MSKPEQILEITPTTELKFIGPFTKTVTSYITLKNPSDKRVCFKIKTTAPKKYCVRPNSGFLTPGETFKIMVSLQPFDFDSNEKNKHKFMVQSIFVGDEADVVENVWKDVQPDQCMDSKLKCVFELPSEDTVAASPSSTVPCEHNNEEHKTTSEEQVSAVSGLTLSTDSEAQSAANREFKQLQAALAAVRQENLQLKEEVLRLTQAVSSSLKSSSGGYSQMPPHNAIHSTKTTTTSDYSIIQWLLCVLLGIVLSLIFRFLFTSNDRA